MLLPLIGVYKSVDNCVCRKAKNISQLKTVPRFAIGQSHNLKNFPSQIAVTLESAHAYRLTHASFLNIIECSVFSNASPDKTHSLTYLKRFLLTRGGSFEKFPQITIFGFAYSQTVRETSFLFEGSVKDIGVCLVTSAPIPVGTRSNNG